MLSFKLFMIYIFPKSMSKKHVQFVSKSNSKLKISIYLYIKPRIELSLDLNPMVPIVQVKSSLLFIIKETLH